MPGLQRNRIPGSKAASEARPQNLSGAVREVRRQRMDIGAELSVLITFQRRLELKIRWHGGPLFIAEIWVMPVEDARRAKLIARHAYSVGLRNRALRDGQQTIDNRYPTELAKPDVLP
jgi:hypothetical protein